MIGRVWHGVVPSEKADAYAQYLAGFGVRDYEAVSGNRGVQVLRRSEGAHVHFLLVSWWSSRAAIEAYAGPDIDRAHYYPYDLECLVDPEPRVAHYEVVAGGGLFPGAGPLRIVAVDHVQLAMPAGGEDAARRFYGDVLGLEEVPKPAALAGRGGVWFRSGEVQLHLGVEADFRPARKAHPALRVEGLTALIIRCVDAGYPVERDVPLPGVERVRVADPFGNRIELMEPRDAEAAT